MSSKSNEMRLFFVFLSVWICGSTYAQDRSIRLEKADWQRVIAKAKEENKLLFIDCNAVWCNPCKALVKDVFSRNVVADFYNENFVSVSYDIERDKSPEFLDMPKISSIPLLLFVNPSTLKIVHGFLGGIDESGMLELGREALDGKRNLAGMRERYQAGERGEALLIPYLRVLKSLYYGEYSEVLAGYFKDMTEERLAIPENWSLFEKEGNDALMPVFQLAWHGREPIATKIGDERVKSKLEEVLTWQVKDNVGRVDRGRSEKNYQKLVAFRDCINSMDWKERDFSLFVLNMAEKAYQGDYDDVLKYLKRFIKKYGVGDEKVGEYVYIFCEKLKENGSPEQILSGIEELDRVVESQKDAGIRSQLMYLKRDMLRAAGYEKEAMRVDTLATKILNPHFYDRK